METPDSPERSPSVQFMRSPTSKLFRQFKNPPQPHMCIQDSIKDTSEKIFINVLGWQKIANPKQYSDPIPLYGGMQVPQGCGPKSNRPPLVVFAVMVNPDILKANGKNAQNTMDRDALVNLLCEFVEAMNPGLSLARRPVILKERDLAGELKDVWLAVQNKRKKEKNNTMYKVYDIDGIGPDDMNDDPTQYGDKPSNQSPNHAGDQPEYNYQIPESIISEQDTYIDTHSNNHLVRENNQTNNVENNLKSDTIKPSTSFRKEWNTVHGKTTEGWDEFSKRNLTIVNSNKKSTPKLNGKPHYDFFPVFNKKTDENTDVSQPIKPEAPANGDSSNLILESMQNLVLHTTDKKLCDNNSSALKSMSS